MSGSIPCCPYCGGVNLTLGDTDLDSVQIRQEVHCQSCGRNWSEVYLASNSSAARQRCGICRVSFLEREPVANDVKHGLCHFRCVALASEEELASDDDTRGSCT